jgi:hypothetical protein
VDYQRYAARVDLDGSISFRAYTLPADGDGLTWRPATVDHRAVVYRIRPGENFENQSFEYWRAFLEERGGAAIVETVIVHEHPPCFPCRGDCRQHPADEYEDMSRQIEHWRNLLRKRGRARRVGHGRVGRYHDQSGG